MFTREKHGQVLIIPYPRTSNAQTVVSTVCESFSRFRRIDISYPGRISLSYASKEALEADFKDHVVVGETTHRVFKACHSTGTRLTIKSEYIPDGTVEEIKEALRDLFKTFGNIIHFQFYYIKGTRHLTHGIEFILDVPGSSPRDLMIPRVASVFGSNVLFTWASGPFCYRCGRSDHTKVACPKPVEYRLVDDLAVNKPILARAFTDDAAPIKTTTFNGKNTPLKSQATTPAQKSPLKMDLIKPNDDGWRQQKKRSSRKSKESNKGSSSDSSSGSEQKKKKVRVETKDNKDSKTAVAPAPSTTEIKDTPAPHPQQVKEGEQDKTSAQEVEATPSSSEASAEVTEATAPSTNLEVEIVDVRIAEQETVESSKLTLPTSDPITFTEGDDDEDDMVMNLDEEDLQAMDVETQIEFIKYMNIPTSGGDSSTSQGDQLKAAWEAYKKRGKIIPTGLAKRVSRQKKPSFLSHLAGKPAGGSLKMTRTSAIAKTSRTRR